MPRPSFSSLVHRIGGVSGVSGVFGFVGLLGVVACSNSDSGSIQLVTGAETDVFSASPAPTQLTVYAWTSATQVSTIATATLPTSSIDLGSQNETSAATLQIKANTASGDNVVAGASLALQYGALAGGTLPVFVQRTNQWARLPSPPSDARQAPTLALLSGEFLVIGGGSAGATSTQIYDFAGLAPVSGPPTLPLSPLSMPTSGTIALLLGQSAAEYYDFSQDAVAAATPPSSDFTWGDVAGGQVVYDVDASSGALQALYVVGGTRTSGAATKAVLEIDATDTSDSSAVMGKLHWIALSDARLGATATWVQGRGLVVTGGSASAAGVETVTGATHAAAGSTAPNKAFPPDASSGAGATLVSSTQLVLAGGLTPTGSDAGVRVLDLTCVQDCSTKGTTRWGALPVPLTEASAFDFASGSKYPAMVVGSELESGVTHAYLLNSAGATEVATKVQHKHGRAIASPLGFGSVLLFGGADEIESLFPPQ